MSQPLSLRPEDTAIIVPLGARDLSIDAALGKYRLLGALGKGGMADIYLGVADGPEGFRKLCVLKLLKEEMAEDDDYRAMFLDEARLAARLNHPNIVQTFEVGETRGRLLIAMEFVDGQPLTRIKRRLKQEHLPLPTYISLLCDVLEALEYAHSLTDFDGSQLGIIHRDVSPHNIVIGYDARVKLLDFGIAKSSAAVQETQAGVLKGKAGYMAPEQARMQPLDKRADIFSVGVILWEAIAGKRLVDGMSAHAVLARRVQGGDPKIAEVVPGVDQALAAICDRAMACSPDARYVSCVELQSDLETWLKTQTDPNRKEFSKHMRDAFAKERDDLRALVEQQMGDSFSGLRSLLGSGGRSTLGRLNPSHGAPETQPTSSGNESRVVVITEGGRLQSHADARVASLVTSDVASAEGTPRSTARAFALFGIAVAVLAGIAIAFITMRSTRQSAETRAEPSALPARRAPTEAPRTTASVDATPTSARPVESVTGAATSSAPPLHRPAWQGFAAPNAKPTPVPSQARTAAPNSTIATPPTKQVPRPIDDKDPYAP